MSLKEIKENAAYKSEEITEKYEITPWKVIKGGICLIGAASASFVVGSVLRNSMPPQVKPMRLIGTVVGIYLLEGVAGGATQQYLADQLSGFDDLFDGKETSDE